MIKIQVLGRGLIPRMNVIAPKKEPFPADKTLIATIMSTPGLKVNFINPETGAPTELTKANLNRIWDKWSNWTPMKKVTQTAPHVPEKPAVYNGTKITGGINPDAKYFENTTDTSSVKDEKPTGLPTPPSEETKATEGKGPNAVKAEAAKPTDEKTADKKDDKDEKPEATQKGDQKNNNFKPIVSKDKK